MERKELISTSPSGNPDYQYYLKSEADAVMDAYEARIKELEETHNLEECPFRSENRELKNRIKELEAIPHTDNSAVIATLQERIKELGTELGTQLGTDQVAEAGKMVWISVKDRMPNVHEKVLVYGWYSPRKNERACFTETCSFSRWDSVYGKWSFSCDGVVTHWMPLPPPPTISKTENVATAEDSSDAGGKK